MALFASCYFSRTSGVRVVFSGEEHGGGNEEGPREDEGAGEGHGTHERQRFPRKGETTVAKKIEPAVTRAL